MDSVTLNVIAWSACLLCAGIAYLATFALKDNARLATVMAVFASAWVLRMGYYSSSEKLSQMAFLVTDLASFLLVLVGLLLVSEGESRHSHRIIAILQFLAFSLAFFMLGPREILFPETFNIPPLSRDKAQDLAALVLGLLALASIALGAWGLRSGAAFKWLLGSLFFYACVSIGRTIAWFIETGPLHYPLDILFVFAFAFAKLALTLSLIAVVIRHVNAATTNSNLPSAAAIVPAAAPPSDVRA